MQKMATNGRIGSGELCPRGFAGYRKFDVRVKGRNRMLSLCRPDLGKTVKRWKSGCDTMISSFGENA